MVMVCISACVIVVTISGNVAHEMINVVVISANYKRVTTISVCHNIAIIGIYASIIVVTPMNGVNATRWSATMTVISKRVRVVGVVGGM